MSSPDSRNVGVVYESNHLQTIKNPYWMPVGVSFEVSPIEMNDWATRIFNASEFLKLFDGDKK